MTKRRARLSSFVARLGRDRRGTTAIEYGLIAAIIIVGMFVAVTNMADATIRLWQHVNTQVANAR